VNILEMGDGKSSKTENKLKTNDLSSSKIEQERVIQVQWQGENCSGQFGGVSESSTNCRSRAINRRAYCEYVGDREYWGARLRPEQQLVVVNVNMS
jgi:hypothetical protein